MSSLSVKVYNKYIDSLKDSLKNNSVISEDTIRYLFYANVIKELKLTHRELSNIQQEVSYSNIILGLGNKKRLLKKNRKKNIISELDSFLDLGKKYAIEFKHHRKISKNQNIRKIPRTKYAGEIFNDINRLSLIDGSINKYFIYLMDDAMINYRIKDQKCLFRKIFDINIDDSFVIRQKDILKQSKTTFNTAYKSFNSKNKGLKNILVTMIYKKDFKVNSINYQLAILKIEDNIKKSKKISE